MPQHRLTALAAILCGALHAAPALALDDVTIRGIEDEELQGQLRGASSLVALESEDAPTSQEVLSAARADYSRMLEVMYSAARYGAVIRISLDGREAADIPVLAAPDSFTNAVITIEPGRKFRFGRTEIGPRPADAELPEDFAPGEWARAPIVREAASNIVSSWQEAGYAKAAVADQRVTARHADRLLDVMIRVEPGREVTFGRIVVAGESSVKPARVRQMAGIPRGERFDPDAVEDAGTRLRKTGTFRSVVITEADTVNPDGSLDFTIDVVDRPPRRIGGGIELTSNEGLALTGYWLHRNLLGGAERFRIDGSVSQIGGGDTDPDFRLKARGERPAVYGADTLFFIEGELAYLDEPDYLTRRAEVAVGVSQEFSDTLTGDLAVALSYSDVSDRYLGRDDDGDYPRREFTLLSLRGGLAWDRRDNQLDATEGTYLELNAEPFVDVTDTETIGARLDMDARAYRSFGADSRTVLAGRFQLGSLVGPDAEDTPPEFLFYSGGSGTVRGQPYNSLDVDYGDVTLGGRSFAALSGELRVGVTENIGVVGFYDAGYVGGESFYDGEGGWHSGAGVGVRYDTLVGPVRLDVAGPVGGDTGEGVQLYLGIGQAF